MVAEAELTRVANAATVRFRPPRTPTRSTREVSVRKGRHGSSTGWLVPPEPSPFLAPRPRFRPPAERVPQPRRSTRLPEGIGRSALSMRGGDDAPDGSRHRETFLDVFQVANFLFNAGVTGRFGVDLLGTRPDSSKRSAASASASSVSHLASSASTFDVPSDSRTRRRASTWLSRAWATFQSFSVSRNWSTCNAWRDSSNRSRLYVSKARSSSRCP